MDRLNTKEAIRRALHHALDDREFMLDCICDDDPYVETVEEEIRAFKVILKRRYGEVTIREQMELEPCDVRFLFRKAKSGTP